MNCGARVVPHDAAKLIEMIDKAQAEGRSLHFRLTYEWRPGEEASFDLLVMDRPNVVTMSGACKMQGGVTP